MNFYRTSKGGNTSKILQRRNREYDKTETPRNRENKDRGENIIEIYVRPVEIISEH